MTPTTDVTIEVSDLDLVKCRRCGAEVRAPRPAYPLRMTAVQRRLRTAGITEGEARDMLDAGEGGRLLTLPGIGPRTIMGLVCDCLTAKPPLAWVASDQQIGKRIRDTRTAANLSQRQLADALGEHGLTITREAISLIESGQRRVSGKEVAGMATVLGTSTDHLLCHDRALPTLAFFP